ncbi:DEAD/DEAH box helicase [Candidatus Bipolaricaulota bacterium]|nr:DEAD/DEAH box helicase [Candidatus Bipolaricaulota bacterium]
MTCCEGSPVPASSVEPVDPLPRLTYIEGEIPDRTAVVDLRLFAQALLPTLSDHRLATLADALGTSCGDGSPGSLCTVVQRLLRFALTREPAICRSLARLIGGPTGDLLEQCAVHSLVDLPADDQRPPSASPQPVDASPPTHRFDSAERVFLPGGLMMSRIPSYEQRPAQVEMAGNVATVLRDGGTLLIEAGAGTGKTFAYLVPVLLYLAEHPSVRAIVSTRTRHLQDQLYEKDLPQLASSLAPRLRCALVKGRDNYICIRRWNQFQQELPLAYGSDRHGDQTQHAVHPDDLAVAALVSWLAATQTGDIEENALFQSLDGHRELWNKLRDDPLHCPASACPHYEDCFSFRARRAARAARLVVANHSLVMSDLAAAGRLLGPYEVLIVDEAHSLEAATRDAFTHSLTRAVIDRLLRDLETRVGRKRTGWISRIAATLSTSDVSSLRGQCKAIEQGNRALFAELEQAIPQQTPDRTPPLDAVAQPAQGLAEQLRLLSRLLIAATEPLDNAESVREGELLSGAAEEAAAVLLHLLVAPRSRDEVHWYERSLGRLALYASPIEVGPILEKTLYPKLDSLVLTSATLAPSQQFSYIRQRLGLDAPPPHPVTEKILPPSFDYGDRMTVLETRFVPSVGSGPDYTQAISDLLVALHKAAPRNTLVLFTSNKMLNDVRMRLPKSLPVLAQGTHGSKQGITQRFRRHPHAILLATGSFWEGIDLPGRQLEVLVITRLPFSVPSEPVFAAQAERAVLQGRDPFLDLSLPLAVLRFRQGIGRLIRTEDDAGLVIITDTRISQRGYGGAFRESLPVSMASVNTPAELANRMAERFPPPIN